MHALDAICGKYDAISFQTCHMQYKKEVGEKKGFVEYPMDKSDVHEKMF